MKEKFQGYSYSRNISRTSQLSFITLFSNFKSSAGFFGKIKLMINYLILLILLTGCIRNEAAKKDIKSDSSILNLNSSRENLQNHYDQLKEDFSSADSVILFSHHSPNMPIKNPETGKYYEKSVPFIDNGRINYERSVKERKQLNGEEIQELSDILTLQATEKLVETTCFQPRNAIVIFGKGKMYCYDFCFECYGFSQYGEFPPPIMMSSEKYRKLYVFYKKSGFKYEMQ